MVSHCLIRGSINIDEFFHVPHVVRPGETISSTYFSRRAGGKGANQAVACARAGAPVSMLGCVGDDGVWLVTTLKGFGVGVERISVVEGATGRALIQLTPEGENCIVLHKGANFAPLPSLSSHVQNDMSSATYILLQNEVPLASTAEFLARASSSSQTAIWNPSPMPTRASLDELGHPFPWSAIKWLLVNETELTDVCVLLEIPASTMSHLSGPLALSDPPEVTAARLSIDALVSCQAFKDLKVVCTLGPLGVLASGHRELIYVPAARLEGTVRDTTGAGDCFTGYFVHGLMQNAGTPSTTEMESILKRCVQAAGMCVERPGAMESVPSNAEVDARLAAT